MSVPLIEIIRATVGLSIQDMGRTGTTAIGLSQGGAMDKLALIEAAALLGKTHPSAAIEFMGVGGSLHVLCDMSIALTGGEMHAKVGDRLLQWNATHTLNAGEIMELSAPKSGVYGYLTPHAELAMPRVFDSQSSHVSAGVGHWLQTGDIINGTPMALARSMKIRAIDRLGGGTIRYLAGPQTDLFSDVDRERFHATPFRASHIANRRGVKIDFEGAPFTPQTAHSIVSDIIVTGDIQMTGDGEPYVLMSECHTMGGYPRIGTVVPADLPILAQAKAGTPIRFEQITLEQTDMIMADPISATTLSTRLSTLVRDPTEISDLLSYQLISGAVTGYED
jgi:allophanate hydrolase